MRTDRRADRTDDGAAGERGTSGLSRRAFVLASGAAVGTAVVGTASGADSSGDRAVVAATEPYRGAVEAAADAVEEGGVRIAAGGDPVARLRDGDLDAYVSGRPTLGDAADLASRPTLAGRAALADASWCDCLDRGTVRERWAADRPVEAWSETDWETLAAVDQPAGAVGDGVPVVRGPRSFQYARGRGGVGYYAPDRESLRVDVDARRSELTPLVRIGYVHSAGDRADDAPVVRRLVGGSARREPEALTYFADPGVAPTA